MRISVFIEGILRKEENLGGYIGNFILRIG
jgi:hypothetical protein